MSAAGELGLPPLTPPGTGAPSAASARGKANRNKGHQAERDVCKWLRKSGFPSAERAVRTGFTTTSRSVADPGDITGTPGIVWSVKDTAVEHQAKWRAELDAMQHDHPDPAAIGLIVHKRRGHANPGVWRCWIAIHDLSALLPGAMPFLGPHWFCATLAEIVDLLHGAGYGDPVELKELS